MIIQKKVLPLQPVSAEIAQLVEHDLAKVGVAGSSPVFRSINKFFSRCPGGGMVDTKDLKSFGFTAVRVQVPPRVLFVNSSCNSLRSQEVSFFFLHSSSQITLPII